MDGIEEKPEIADGDMAPGDEKSGNIWSGVMGYCTGFVLALGLSIMSFYVAYGESGIIWVPSIPIALLVLAVAQMGVHLVFFLHITSGPDNTNNIMALAFGVLIVLLVAIGSLWIMANLNSNMMPMDQMIEMQR